MKVYASSFFNMSLFANLKYFSKFAHKLELDVVVIDQMILTVPCLHHLTIKDKIYKYEDTISCF